MIYDGDFVPGGLYVDRFQAPPLTGALVVVDILRAFTTAAYAFAGGAERIYLVDSVPEALAAKAANPGWLAMGENHGKKVEGFDLTNSPVQISNTDVRGRTLIQRTTAGTRGVVACSSADRVWAASLVTASATARALTAAGLGQPHYVVTGSWPGRTLAGNDDWWTAEYINALYAGGAPDPGAVEDAIRTSSEADFTLGLGFGNADPEDVEFALRTDLFDFALEAVRSPNGMWELLRR